jgi:hypothetical protein
MKGARTLVSAVDGINVNSLAMPVVVGSSPGLPRHVCAFFNNEEERYRVLLPFIKEGFERGDKGVHVIDRERRSNHLERLLTAGIDVAAAERSGQFELRANTDTYLRDGQFDKDRMLASFEQMVTENEAGRFPCSRIVCHMEWAADHGVDMDELIEFESRVNEVWCRHQSAVVCTYDLTRFGGAAVIDIIRTHPLVIMGGVLHENPFFVPPEEFLREVRARRGIGTLATPATV